MFLMFQIIALDVSIEALIKNGPILRTFPYSLVDVTAEGVQRERGGEKRQPLTLQGTACLFLLGR